MIDNNACYGVHLQYDKDEDTKSQDLQAPDLGAQDHDHGGPRSFDHGLSDLEVRSLIMVT